ncbi:hypothetical protein [Roseomonas mucosa]|uniref:hypothetical protein n=1 Tax=Roseomonas mucosa TaxID=207340 RepID=UPI001DEC67A6|nr:hypothetical protein [Roseomonas mucosa]MBS5905031.1 hypothetical protein [Acetobacteraceae bacterium]MCG7353296.1 hypothetical protein [Roseomonas mucosa]
MEIRRLASRPETALLTLVSPTATHDAVACSRCSTAFGTDPTISVGCPVCRALEGERCRQPAQGGFHRSHYIRARIALALGRMSACPGLTWDDLHALPVRVAPASPAIAQCAPESP